MMRLLVGILYSRCLIIAIPILYQSNKSILLFQLPFNSDNSFFTFSRIDPAVALTCISVICEEDGKLRPICNSVCVEDKAQEARHAQVSSHEFHSQRPHALILI